MLGTEQLCSCTEGSPGPRNATLLALTNKAVGELAQSLGQPADGSTTFLNPNSQATIEYLKALITPLYQEPKALDVYGDNSVSACSGNNAHQPIA